MKFSLETTAANQILSYDQTHIVIEPGKQSYYLQSQKSLIITPSKVMTDPQIDDIACLSAPVLDALQKLAPEIVIFGLATKPLFPPLKTLLALAKLSIGVETMALGAACRIYNLLVLEGRRALLIIMRSQ